MEGEALGGEAAGDEGGEGGVGSGDGEDRNAGGDGGLNELGAGVGDAGSAGVRDDGDAGAGLELGYKLLGALGLVEEMVAEGGGDDLKVVEEFLRLARVFAGDLVGLAQDAKGAQGDVLEVADGGGDEIEAGGEGFGFGGHPQKCRLVEEQRQRTNAEDAEDSQRCAE